MFDAAMSLYAEAGWVGFNFDAVAARSGVGKASIYGRWPTRGDLLRRTFEERWFAVGSIDTGSLRDDLLALARMIGRALTGPYSGAQAHIAVDALKSSELREIFRPYAEATMRQSRAIVRRAIGRGEIADGVDPGLVMDLVAGAVGNRLRTTPQRLRGAMMNRMDAFLETLVDTVLRGVEAKEVG